MKSNLVPKTFTRLTKVGAAILVVGIALLPAVEAKAGSNKPIATDTVAHTMIPGGPVTRMLLVKEAGKRFLLLGFSSPASVEVLDVTDPSQPHPLDSQSGASSTYVNNLEIVSETLSVFRGATAGSSGTTGSEPDEIQRISGVKTFVIDKERRLIYVSNSEGLWIVKTKRRQRFDDDQASAAELYGAGG